MTMMSAGTQIKSSGKDDGAVMQIVGAIKRMLIDNNLKVGDKIPPEPVLCEKFGKSRSSVREAVKILESFGVLHVRKGDGTYITASANTGIFDALFFRIIAMGTNFQELVQLRIILETAIIDMIISNNDGHTIAEIKKINEKLEREIANNGDIETLIQFDVDFHIALSAFSGNGLLKNVYMNMMDLFVPFIRNSYTTQRETREYFSLDHHSAIIQAIEERDYDLAHYAVKKSMRAWKDQNKDSIGDKQSK